MIELSNRERWIDNKAAWKDRGVEYAAQVVAWGLSDEPIQLVELGRPPCSETTAVFDITWLDRNDDGSTELSCGWYFADKVDGKWLLSQYISMECAE